MTGNFHCKDRFIVYQFSCVLCNEFYIGQTCRPFKLRFNEHKRNIAQNSLNSALAEHALKVHVNRGLTISDFDLKILRRCRTPLEARLTEARLISIHRPQLNRKHEMTAI